MRIWAGHFVDTVKDKVDLVVAHEANKVIYLLAGEAILSKFACNALISCGANIDIVDVHVDRFREASMSAQVILTKITAASDDMLIIGLKGKQQLRLKHVVDPENARYHRAHFGLTTS